jgi:hypothetical protein
MKDGKILAARWRDVSEIPLPKVLNAKLPGEKIAVIVAHLELRGAARPCKTKTLRNTINSLFQFVLSSRSSSGLVNELQAQALISISDNNVSYSLLG